jgi:hypothetical protein
MSHISRFSDHVDVIAQVSNAVASMITYILTVTYQMGHWVEPLYEMVGGKTHYQIIRVGDASQLVLDFLDKSGPGKGLEVCRDSCWRWFFADSDLVHGMVVQPDWLINGSRCWADR